MLSLVICLRFLFENIFIIERLKKAMYSEEFKNYFFWRTYDQKEIDFIELYIVPGSLASGKSDILDDLKNIPTAIHCPHTEHPPIEYNQ